MVAPVVATDTAISISGFMPLRHGGPIAAPAFVSLSHRHRVNGPHRAAFRRDACGLFVV